ncbi:MAG: response regulator [Candidatus Delongbacteria bacterium]|nr:response regulator [Candidatus Delongbacteria bacterium]
MARDFTLVSVDDSRENLLVIELLAKKMGFRISSFLSPVEAWEFIQSNPIDLALVDYMMPQFDGIELITRIRRLEDRIPIIMITAISDDSDIRLQALQAGATEFLSKPIHSAEFKARVTNLLELRKSQKILMNKSLLLEHEIQVATADILDREHESLCMIGKAAEYKDPETGRHILRVSHYSRYLAKLAGLDDTNQNLIFYASPLHDVGKIGIPDQILLKPGRLTTDEFELMKTHTIIGNSILAKTRSPFLVTGSMIALTHHEKFDGTGYPYALQGKDIPVMGRIVAIADVLDALTSRRPYKEAISFDESVGMMAEQRSRHFDPDLLDLFIDHRDAFYHIFKEYQDT